MARPKAAAVPAAPRKTLLEWIDLDDGDTSSTSAPACDKRDQALHARIFGVAGGKASEPLQPPPGLRLAPLG